MSKRVFVILSLIASIGAMTWVMWGSDGPPPPSQEDASNAPRQLILEDIPLPTPVITRLNAPEDESEQGALLVVQDSRGRLLGSSASILLSAAGLYPPLSIKTDGDGRARASIPPNPMLSNQEDGPVEVMVRVEDGSRGFWGVVYPIKNDEKIETDDELIEYAVQVVPAPAFVVNVVDEHGEPVASSKVQVALSEVHLLNRREFTSETGRAMFTQLPEGNYSIEVNAPGFMIQRLDVNHSSDVTAALSVTVLPTREIYGCLVDELGAGVPGATILGHVARRETSWFGQTLEAMDVVRVDGPPIEALTQTDFDGCFSLTGLPAGEVYVQAQAAWAPPSVTGPFDVTQAIEIGPVELTLNEGSAVRVRVVGGDRQPVAGATVRWVDSVTGRAGVGVSDVSGEVMFAGLSTRVLIDASLGAWRSPSVRLGQPEEDGEFLVTAQLEQASAMVSWTLRLNAPRGVEPVEAHASLETSSGPVVCEGRSLNERDWRFEDCPKGAAILRVNTASHGVWLTRAFSGEDLELSLPAPQRARVVVTGVTREDHSQTTLQWSAAGALDEDHAAALTPLDEGDLEWRASLLYPGTYALSLEVRQEPFARTVDVQKSPKQDTITWPVTMPRRLGVRVLDARGSLVKGAMIRVVEDGVVSDKTSASESAPLPFRINATKTLRLWATSARQGEGSLDVMLEDEPPA